MTDQSTAPTVEHFAIWYRPEHERIGSPPVVQAHTLTGETRSDGSTWLMWQWIDQLGAMPRIIWEIPSHHVYGTVAFSSAMQAMLATLKEPRFMP